MNRNEFLTVVGDFINWMVERLGQFQHSWASISPRTGFPKGYIWCCESLFDAFSKYRWPSTCNGNKIDSFDDTAICLGELEGGLKAAIDKEDGVGCRACCNAILEWGGVAHRVSIARNIRDISDEDLPSFLKAVQKYFNNTNLDSSHEFVYRRRNGDEVPLGIDSGTTKIYSLICDNLIIYDSRVGAALGLFVRQWSEQNNIREIPDCLQFAWGDNQNNVSREQRRRNPNARDQNVFPYIHNPGVDRRKHNIIASWLLHEVLTHDGRSNRKSHSDFQKLPEKQRLRALEAALFMVGYCVNQIYGPSCNEALFVNDTVLPFISTEDAVTRIRAMFQDTDTINVHNQLGNEFSATLQDDGILVDNLGNAGVLHWAVFSAVVRLLNENDGQAVKGNAMNYHLGDPDLPLDSIEGYVAHEVYGKQVGDRILRRITPIAGILIAAGICVNQPGRLVFA